MENSFQKIIAAIVAILILFIVPVYMAFEKVDDVSYNLVLKLTQNFVDNVRDKGYISPEMYTEYVSSLYATNNSYDVQIEHIKKRYDPVIYVYSKNNGNRDKLLYTLDYDKYTVDGSINPSGITINGVNYNSANSESEIAHVINEEHITDKQIVRQLFAGTSITKEKFLLDCLLGNRKKYETMVYINDNSYIMNEGDRIIVRVRNSNQTVASMFYSQLSANVGLEEVPKIYVSYGGAIRNNGESIVDKVNGNVEDTETGRIFKYRGIAEEVTLSAGKYKIQCWGASGGGVDDYTAWTSTGGKGAYAETTVELTEETTVYVYVGGQGKKYTAENVQNGGYNGGGNSYKGFGGGGATDVRLKKGEWDDTESLLTRFIVAGGGGGSSKPNASLMYGTGGYAGAYSTKASDGEKITGTSGQIGLGAKNTTVSVGYSVTDAAGVVEISPDENGNLGRGGSVDYDGAGAGGAGYVGGSAAHGEYAGGGGGLSYVYSSSIPSFVGDMYKEILQRVNLSTYITGTSTFRLNNIICTDSNIKNGDSVFTVGIGAESKDAKR